MPQVRVLNVAEKPSVAREITRHLGGQNVSRRYCHGVSVSEFLGVGMALEYAFQTLYFRWFNNMFDCDSIVGFSKSIYVATKELFSLSLVKSISLFCPVNQTKEGEAPANDMNV